MDEIVKFLTSATPHVTLRLLGAVLIIFAAFRALISINSLGYAASSADPQIAIAWLETAGKAEWSCFNLLMGALFCFVLPLIVSWPEGANGDPVVTTRIWMKQLLYLAVMTAAVLPMGYFARKLFAPVAYSQLVETYEHSIISHSTAPAPATAQPRPNIRDRAPAAEVSSSSDEPKETPAKQ